MFIKMLDESLRNNKKALEWFHHEIQVLKYLQTNAEDYFIPLLHEGEYKYIPYFVQPHVNGQSLAKYLEKGPLQPIAALRILENCLRTVCEIHQNGILHLDLSPENIIVLLTEESISVTNRQYRKKHDSY
ncbi:hypothetical protein JW935_23260 [candidate division KSB1 bacterium]|nr:hypothetical protein [candidate division KSB1 bacterium]